ncbi:DeoR family transcriptional regulator [Lactobacillus crispatus]|uniref:DeoR family transcriptional regulator n=1 Tax=Lactobacillus crispatus TaxID=47770 RepID=UPI003369ED9B
MKNSIQVIKKRRKQIIDLLNHTREISISELSKKMKVSEMTIRRDCDYLSKMGKISKKRGVISLVAPEEIPLSQPVSYIKQSLGKEAARYIHDGDIVFINSSSTAFDAIPHLLTKDIIIVTNNGYAGNFENTKSKVILTGGEIHIN